MAQKTSPMSRSQMMAGIRGRDTRPEMAVRSFLHAKGLRFRIHRKDLPGTPDVVLPRYQVVIFVHGCFWHGHVGCKYFRLPKTRREFWESKIQANSKRDANAILRLMSDGWRVATVWECALKERQAEALNALVGFVNSDAPSVEIGTP